MPRYRIEYDRSGCIGAAICVAADPAHFVLSNEDGKADLVGAQKENDKWVLEWDDINDMKAAADGCPVQVIKILDKETGKQLV